MVLSQVETCKHLFCDRLIFEIDNRHKFQKIQFSNFLTFQGHHALALSIVEE